MADTPNVPGDQKISFNRIMNLAPDELREDFSFQETILMYLKVGGEKLARQHIKVATQPFYDEFTIKQRLTDETVEETEETADDQEGSEENENEEESEGEASETTKES